MGFRFVFETHHDQSLCGCGATLSRSLQKSSARHTGQVEEYCSHR